MISHIVDRFIPPELEKDPENKRRAKGLVIVSFALAPWWPAFAHAYSKTHVHRILVFGTLALGVFLFTVPFLLKWTKSLRLSTNFLVFLVQGTLLMNAFTDGGIHSQAILALPCLILAAIYLSDIASGLIWTAICCAFVTYFYYLDYSGHPIPLQVSPEEATKLLFMNQLAILLTIAIVTAYYEKIRNELYKTALEQQQKIITSSKMAALGEMAGGMAHEINNPLGIIKLHAEQLEELLEESSVDKQQAHEMSHAIVKTVQRIAGVVSGLRNFSRNAENEPFGSISMQSVLEDTLNLCREKFRNASISLRLEKPASDITVQGRAVQISQALLNLLNNAFDAVHALPEKWIRIDVSVQEKTVQIAVTDGGKGIPATVRDRIFQPFFTTKDVGRGTGLGLSVSKGILEAHRGRLFLDERSTNTRFVMELPRD